MRKFRNAIVKEALCLRKMGHSISEISTRTGLPKGTIYEWVKGLKLTKSQRARLKIKAVLCGRRGLTRALRVNRNNKIKWMKNIEQKTRKFGSILDKRSDIAKLICGVLYLCEGARYPATRHLVFGSSDPRMIKIFLTLLRDNFDIDEKKFRCRIMHRYDQNGDALNRYWTKLTKVPLSQFYRSYRDRRTKGKITKRKDYRGICAVNYFDTELQYELQLIGESIF